MNRLDDILRRYTVQGEEDTKDKLLGAAGSSGRLDLDPKSPPFTEKAFTWAASLTKLATSISVLQLVERGQLDLDADLRPLIPELRQARILRGFDDDDKPVIEANTRPITMRQLLTHTSGFSYEFSDPVLLQWSRTQPNRHVTRLQWSKLEVTTPLRFAPGESWGYGVGLDWAGQVLEAITGKSLGQYMQENILDPVGLADTGFWPERLPHTAPRTAQNVQRTRDGRLAAAQPPTPEKHEIESGGGGWFTTASDYALFLRAFLAGRLLSRRSMADVMTPQLNEAQAEHLSAIAFHPMVHNTFAPEFAPGTVINYGLGAMLNVDHVPGKRRAGSIAWSGILNSRWWVDAKTGIAGVLVVNVRPNGDPVVAKLYHELELAVYGHLLRQPAAQSRI
ncbi:Beta-lactamase/transpeptidase-like protein [Metarhizium album ARSEF 1941]|uniref:Beta-lactamase/transpeptidase-like protein n=1 Tax=Metarhizium album (strain ARSEF 1941) TaxID=1081103 RepID=A0A0B2WY06_METAS|nr:Beta-lactamase/transpeptidase-like protein [Metarhizium album ARSEF 1941]KHN97730.1 Beta-lactamase/transpeptidase-like protein [Metarhizium album ARSEF 1941]